MNKALMALHRIAGYLDAARNLPTQDDFEKLATFVNQAIEDAEREECPAAVAPWQQASPSMPDMPFTITSTNSIGHGTMGQSVSHADIQAAYDAAQIRATEHPEPDAGLLAALREALNAQTA